MGKVCSVKQRAGRKGFWRVRRQLVNNVNTGINLSNVNIESKNDNLIIHDQSGSTTATATFAASNETFSFSQTSSVSSSKKEDIEEKSPKRRESISGNRIIDVNILKGIFGVMLSPKDITFHLKYH